MFSVAGCIQVTVVVDTPPYDVIDGHARDDPLYAWLFDLMLCFLKKEKKN